jgi:hypothetical protein
MSDTRSIETIDVLKRKARSINLQAGRAAPSLARQLRSLAALYETQADLVARGAPCAPEFR